MTQPDAEVMVDFDLEQTGKRYTTQRPIQEYADGYDCSALVVAGQRHMCDAAGVPWIIPANVGNTVDLYNWGKSVGGLCSVDKAVRTRGAILIKGKNYGYGPLGHTAISLGDGTEMAAHGVSSGIHPSDVFGGRNYQDGLILPGVFYKDLEPPVDPAVLEAIAQLVEWGARVTATPLVWKESGPDVTVLNRLLISWGMLPTHFKYMNVYSLDTAAAVRHFKLRKVPTSTVGKKFGGDAVAAILAPR